MTVTSSGTNGFLFADLRDYTRYVESHGDRAAAALLDAYRALVRATVAEFGGAEIKTEGDSFYVVFPSASKAVQCGLAILDAASKSTAAGGGPIRVGIGVHAGETVETSEGYVGSAVNVAARVCSQAKPGELLVTDTVRALTRTFLQVKFVDRRVRKLKGIEESVVLYRVEPAAVEAEVAAKPVSGISRPVRTAVLLIGLLVGGAAAGYVLLAAQRPPNGTTAPTATAPPVAATFPDGAESDLLAQVPAAVRERCVRAPGAEALAGTSASLRCDLEFGAEADTVWYHRFHTGQEMANYLSSVQQAQQLRLGTCDADTPRAQGDWQVGTTLSGQLFCFESEGSTWIVWTYAADRILARATRTGDTAADWAGLYGWWKLARLFVSG